MAWLAGCAADIGDAGESSPGDGQGETGAGDPLEDLGPTPGGVEVACDAGLDLAATPLLKLSTVQYRNTVRDVLQRHDLDSLLPMVEPLLSRIPNDTLSDGFRGLDDRVSLEHVQGYFDVSVAVGDALRDDPALLTGIAGDCAASAAMSSDEALTDGCWRGFVDGFLKVVHRRPLFPSEVATYDAIRDEAASPLEAFRGAIVVALSSPRFVYHVEVDGRDAGGRADLLQLDGYEVASRLAYTFWQTLPDAELLAAAEDGSLLEEAGYAAQLERVWEDPRTRATLRRFWEEWLRLEEFTGFETARPAFKALAVGEGFDDPDKDHYAAMVAEVHALTDLMTFEERASVDELLTTRKSVTTSPDLASLYGVEPYDGSGSYPEFPEGERAGLLQRAALLVSNLEQTNPFHRGALIRRAILCDPLPQPDPTELPPGALDPPPVDEAQTTRERFAAKVDGNDLCQGCHRSFSTIGYVLESYDALGRYRTKEKVFDEQTGELLAELPIDTSGVAAVASGAEDPVSGPAELNQRILESGKFAECMAEKYFEYVSRRAFQFRSLDRCMVEDLTSTLAEKPGGLAAAFQRVARLSTFFSRRIGPSTPTEENAQ